MKKLSAVLFAAVSFVFPLASRLFYSQYIAWNALPIVVLLNLLCTVCFAVTAAMLFYKKENSMAKNAVPAVVGAAVHEVLLWGLLTVINTGGQFNVKAANTAYFVLMPLWLLMTAAVAVRFIKSGRKAAGAFTGIAAAVILTLVAATPLSPFLTDLFKGDVDLYTDNYVFNDYSYGEHERQVLDLYIPKETPHDSGLILFIHGGGWIAGSKNDYSEAMKNWNEKGYICASVSYHYVSDAVHMDVLMNDITAALSAVKELAGEKGYSIDKCLLTGGSAGGHLSLLYAYKEGRNAPIRPAAVVSYCGPADLRNSRYIFGNRLGDENFMSSLMSWVCGESVDPGALEKTEDALFEYSPLKYAVSAVPTVFAHGEIDSVVPFEDTVVLSEELEKLGVENVLVRYPDSDHDLAADPDSAAETERLFEIYAEKYIG